MAKRINVILPETMISTIDRLVPPGGRSLFIDRAVRHYVATRSALGLREQLKQAAIRDRDLDGGIDLDWAAVDHNTWQHIDQRPERKVQSRARGRAAGKSTSRRSIRP